MGTGFFGKLPSAGDFVARGLPGGLQGALDRWVTARIAPLVRVAEGWPDGGVRAAVVLKDTPWLLVIEPGFDAVGRCYPLVACAPQAGADRAGADIWADAASAALECATAQNAPPDALGDLLAQIPAPTAALVPVAPPVLWWGGVAPGPVQQQLARLARLSSG